MFASAWRQSRWHLLVLLAVVACSRLPFLNAGYGANVDAWRVARVARQLSETGVYEVSRFPGYPVHEIVCSWLWRGGPCALNGASALCSIIAVLAFVGCARRVRCRDPLLAGLALAMTPEFFINSVTSKDYVWASAALLASLFCTLGRRPVLGGLLLGLAVGCRITSAAMILPLALILFGQVEPVRPWRAVGLFCLTSISISLVMFLPIWLRYGDSFLTFYENHSRPPWETIVRRATSEVWGNLGMLGLAVVATGFAFYFGRERAQLSPLSSTRNRLLFPALGLTILTYTAAYLRLPDQAGYLIPIIPAMLLLAAHFAPRICFQFCCLCLTIAPFVDLNSNGLEAGGILADHRARLTTIRNITSCLDFAEKLPGENVIVVGGWEPQIAVLAPDRPWLRNRYVYLLSPGDISIAQRSGRQIFYLPAIRAFNARIYHIDLARYGSDLFAVYQARLAETQTR